MRSSIVLSLLFGLGGVAVAERPAHDQTCQCSCTPSDTAASPSSSGGMRGTDADIPLSQQPLPPRPVPREDRDAPHIFDTPGSGPATPGLPTPTPWRD